MLGKIHKRVAERRVVFDTVTKSVVECARF